MGGRGGHIADVAKRFSPRHRRWRALLASLSLDPADLPTTISWRDERDFLMCGSPRSGTALLTAMLFQPPSIVTVMEPWDALRMPADQLLASLRKEVRSTGELRRGRLDLPTLTSTGVVRWCRDGERPWPVTVDENFRLGVKLPAFWRYLPMIPAARFVVCLRHPFEVIASYRTTGGRLAEGFDYDVPFNRSMNAELAAATDDPAVRRVLLYDHVHRGLLPHLERDTVLPVRYERWFSDAAGQLADISTFLGVPLGDPPARVAPPRNVTAPDPATRRERDLIRRHCRTAAALGYSLEESP